MSNTVTTKIDSEKCIGCGNCIRVCPQDTISMVDGRARVTGKTSLNCGHCEAICPTGAVTVGGLEPSMHEFSGFQMDRNWLPFGSGGTADLARLMASRRSTRNYRNTPVPESVLTDLVKIGCLAPSGTNCQLWTYTILRNRQELVHVGRLTTDFFSKLNRLARNPLARLFSAQLRTYHREYAAQVEEGISEFRSGGRDMLFHGAPAAIVIGSRPGASCAGEDALLASQNILLAAHTMGYGTCLIGMVVEAARRQPRIRRALGIQEGEQIHSVIVIGEPDEPWRRVAGRLKADVRMLG